MPSATKVTSKSADSTPSEEAVLTGALELLITVKLMTPQPEAYEKLAFLKAQCLDEGSVYRDTVVSQGWDPLDRGSIRLATCLDREGQKR